MPNLPLPQSQIKLAELAYKAVVIGNTSLRFKISGALSDYREVVLRDNSIPPRTNPGERAAALQTAVAKVAASLAQWGFPPPVITALSAIQSANEFQDEYKYLERVGTPLEGSYTGSSCDEGTLPEAFKKLFA